MVLISKCQYKSNSSAEKHLTVFYLPQQTQTQKLEKRNVLN